ncbi:MAG: shikimate dehydrogenase [Ruminococcaceae bacterium]|nr:shikimate dehydrogenase [Oscillospiraceae bacterium]
MIKKFGVIGCPIGHTMSPFIHAELFKMRGVSAEYGKFETESENLPLIFEKNLDGFNVTIPHKIAITKFLDELDSSAAEYGAVNTVCRKNGKYLGFNTDAYGFLKGLELSGICLEGRVVVLGYGGAARTIITECLKAGCEVTVATTPERTEKAQTAIKEITEKTGRMAKVICQNELNEEYDLLVNATPVGMYPKTDEIPLAEQQINLFKAAYDIVYNPTETRLIKTAKTLGKVCSSGMSMLVCQAQKAQNIWLGSEFTNKETAKLILEAERELERIFRK